MTQNEATEAEDTPGPNLLATLHHLANSPSTDLTLRTRRVLTLLEWKRFERQGCPADGTATLLTHYGQMAEEARSLGQPDAEAVALAGIGSLQITAGRLAEARRNLEQAIRIYAHVAPPVAAAVEHALLALIDWARGDLPAAVQGCTVALRAVESQVPQKRRLLVLSAAALPMLDMGHGPLAARLQAMLAAWRGDPEFDADPALAAARAALLHDQGRSQEALEAMVQLLASRDGPYGRLVFLRQWGQATMRMAMALDQEREVLSRLQALPDWAAMNRCPEFQRTLAHAEASHARRSGLRSAAAERLQSLSVEPGQGPATRAQCLATLDLAWCALQQGDTYTAGQRLTALGGQFSQHPLGLAARGHLHRQLRRHTEADALLDSAQVLWGRGQAAWWNGPQADSRLLSTMLLPLA